MAYRHLRIGGTDDCSGRLKQLCQLIRKFWLLDPIENVLAAASGFRHLWTPQLASISVGGSTVKNHFSLVLWVRIQSASFFSETWLSASASISVTTSASVACRSYPFIPRNVEIASRPTRLFPSLYG